MPFSYFNIKTFRPGEASGHFFPLFLAFLLLAAAYFLPAPQGADEQGVFDAMASGSFGMTGVELGDFDRAVLELEESLKELSGRYENKEDRELILNLHPISFLKSLGELERARRKAARNPSKENLALWRDNFRNTVAAYKEELTDYRRSLLSYQTEENEIYHFVDSTTSLKTLIYDSERLLENAGFFEKGFWNAWSNSRPLFSDWRPVAIEKPLSREDLESMEFLEKFFDQKKWKILMPPAEVSTDCFGRGGENDLFYLVQYKEYFLPIYFKPLFFDISDDNSRHFAPLKQAGFNHYWQPEFHYYLCPDPTYQAELLTLYKIRGLLAEWKYEASPLAGALDGMIGKFLSEEPLYRRTQLAFMESVSALLQNDREEELRALLGPENFEILKTVSLLSREKSGYFENLVLRGAFVNRNFLRLLPRLSRPVSAKEVLISRAYPALYFLPFIRSIWLSAEPLNFFYSLERSSRYSNFDEIKRLYSREDIMRIMKLSFSLLNL